MFSHSQQSNLSNRYLQQQHHPPSHRAPSSLPPPTQGHPGFAALSQQSVSNGNHSSLFTSSFGQNGQQHSLASQAAQMGFANATNAVSLDQMNLNAGQGAISAKGRIREVWKNNLNQEMAMLRQLVERYPIIAMVRLQRCEARD
jgi:CCR4-NOT transcription complex subunit 7/8